MMISILACGRRPLPLFGALLFVATLAGCATPAAPPPSKGELPFEQAVAEVTDALVLQIPKPSALIARMSARRGVVLDPMIDAGSAQQTVATQLLQERVSERIGARHDSIEILPFQSANLARARYLLTGTMTRLSVEQARSPLRIDLALTELASGMVVAQSSGVARDDGLDHTPLPYYQDAPVPIKDPIIESYVRTTATPAGQRADPYYLERIAIAPVIKDATTHYNAERYQDALTQYNSAAGGTASDAQLRVLNGIYLSSAKLGRTAEAEQAFGKIVAYGIAHQQLGVKFLFNPGGTVFWADAKVSGPYPMWLREIAKASAGANVCMDIVGHTSRTGSVAFNDALSMQRARFIRQRLIGEAGVLGDRTRTDGKGFRENIIGSGTDDAVDALDRRVEFRIVGCG
ncbi:OmpA family protein [Variovorax soli]|uniref:Outer membrane protein OmpA-like peptidoglycan-associated protein n=1 Tax=Variovorax soli TaxID=376815 RepID=A0ABU1NAR4_9BURK|nr:OmpA family protein [Variovorax soli]MDR6534991.1 outer membrane protein OmpA-like peptidoglycan-associated protein [Variovorax soli]